MNHDLNKMLSDRNPDGSVLFSVEDMEIITEEDNNAQVALRNLILQDYTVLLEEIRKRIDGIATFADNNENNAVRVSFDTDCNGTPCAVILVDFWGEKLEETQLFEKDEVIGHWTCSDASSHRFYFHLPVTNEISRQASQIELGISHT